MKLSTNLDLQNLYKVINVPLPSAPGDLASKAYIDALKAGEDWKASCRLATTTNVSIVAAPAAFDTVTAVAGDRIFVKDQTAAAENGIYIFHGAASPMTRADDAIQGDVSPGMVAFIEEGATQGGTKYQLLTPLPITVGTTALTFTQTGAPITVTSPLTRTGNNIALSTVPIASGGTGATSPAAARTALAAITKYAADFGDGAATSFNIDHNLGTTDVTVMVFNKSTGAVELVDITVSTSNRVIVSGFAAAPTAAAYRVVVTG